MVTVKEHLVLSYALPIVGFVTLVCLHSLWLFYASAKPLAVRKGLSLKELVESRDEEIARAELAVRHREGTDSFHLKKMMELAYRGALLLFAAAAVATGFIAQCFLLAWQPNLMNSDSNLSIRFFFYHLDLMQSS